MKLRALDQIHISSVQRDPIAPGQLFEVSDDMGKQLIEKHPATFEKVVSRGESKSNVDEQPESAGEAQKAEDAPQNKAEDAPANKADPRRKAKS